MSWQDRDYAADENPLRRFGRPGGDWQGIRPSFDNPMTWSLPLGRVAGITVRVHLIFLIFIVVELLRALFDGQGGTFALSLTGLSLGSLFVIVLLHEFGHCLACRATGGSADEILMWPLGGLAYCSPVNRWQAHLATVVGGPAVNVALACVFVPLLGLATGAWWGVAVPNPFSVAGLYDPAVSQSWLLKAVYLAGQINLIILLFNLLPIFPLDGGRLAQTLMWPWLGYVRSMRVAVRVGYLGAIVLGITGLVMSQFMLLVIAVFGGITCYITHRQLQLGDEMMGFESDQYAANLYGPEKRPARPSPARLRRAQRRVRREQQESRTVDRILEKINQRGMESLTGAEKRLLKRVTRRKKKG